METGPAEEDFSWACGHCFFERRKKFAIKDYLIRQVCRKSIASKKSRGQAGRAKLKRHLSCDCAREKDESIRGKTSFPCKPPGRQILCSMCDLCSTLTAKAMILSLFVVQLQR